MSDVVLDSIRSLSYAGLTAGQATILWDKKLSCRRETARCIVSLNILISHSRSLKVIRNDTLDYGVCKSLNVMPISLQLFLYLVPLLRYSASNNGVIFKLKLEVVQGH